MLAVNWMRNKDIAMIHLHYYSSPLLHPHPDLFQQVTWYSTLSLFLFSCLALMVVLWCYGWNLHPHEEREHLFPCWMTAVQGCFGDSAVLLENEASPPDTFKQGYLELCWEEPLSSYAVCHGQYGFVQLATL